MIFLKNKFFYGILLGACIIHAIPLTHHEDFFEEALNGIKEYQAPICTASLLAASYVGYAIYLDRHVAHKDSLWYWAIHHIKDGIIDQSTLMFYMEEQYPDLRALHPLMAIFAMLQDAQKEIDACLTLRSMLKNLNYVNLAWVLGETIASVDKKLESLYILKIMLAHCTVEMRNRCKKRAQLL